MELTTIKIKDQKQVLVSKTELLSVLGFDSNEWNLHGAYVSSLDNGNITFGISKKNVDPFEMINDGV